ncbi:MAG: hypothetical protein QXX38_01470 [Candidatus Aenigmatarchaeota archaeon]
MNSSLGRIRESPQYLKYRFKQEEILNKLSSQLENIASEAYSRIKRERKIFKLYCIIELPIPKDDRKILGNFPTKLFELSLPTVEKIELPSREWRDFSIYRFGLQSYIQNKEDIITLLGLILENERLNYLPFIGSEVGISHSSEGKTSVYSYHRLASTTFKKERFQPPFKDLFEFLPYYLSVVDSGKMFIKELYDRRNLAVCRMSEGLVWIRRTRNGKDIRINSPDEITDDLVPWGAFEFFVEDNKCWLEKTNCSECDKLCFPNVCFDLDPGEKIEREKCIHVLTLIQKFLEDKGIHYVIKHTGGRGYNIDIFIKNFTPPEAGVYIPLNVLKHQREMSSKRMKEIIEEKAYNPYDVIRDFVRMITDYLRGDLDFLVHDMSSSAWQLNTITVDAGSIKRRSYHKAYYTLTEKKTMCLPISPETNKEEIKKIDEISKKFSDIGEYLDQLPYVEIKYIDSTFIRDFIEDEERRLYKELYDDCLRRLRFLG